MIGGNEGQKVSNRYGDACGSYYLALPSILSSPKKQDEHNVSSANYACLSVHFDKVLIRISIRHNLYPSRTIIQYQEQTGEPPHPRLSHPEVLDFDRLWAMHKAVNLREEVTGEIPKPDTFFVYYAGKNTVSLYEQNESFAKEKQDKHYVSSAKETQTEHNGSYAKGKQKTKLPHVKIRLQSAVSKQSARTFIIDSGASLHLLSSTDLTVAEKKSLRRLATPLELNTANGEVSVEWEAKVRVKEIGNELVTALLLDDTPAVLSFGRL